MVICIFGNTVVKPGKEEGEAQLSAKLEPILRAMPGFISYKNYVADDGEEIGLIRFDSRESLDAWAHEGVHGQAQAVAPEFYESFWVQDVETYREYTWERGVHTDGDLTPLFLEG
jgi:antibiotic biosynthesis monooxygenase (ABM) superfamily enzyme